MYISLYLYSQYVMLVLLSMNPVNHSITDTLNSFVYILY